MKLYSFTIDALPPSVNHIWRATSRRRPDGRPAFYKDPKAKEFETLAGYRLKRVKRPLEGIFELNLVFVFKSAKRLAQRDLDNMIKLTGDVLTSFGIINDDSQFYKIVCEKKAGDTDQVAGTISILS